jgi:hypothetical protein
MRWVGHVALIREMRNACKVLLGKREGKRLLGIYRRTWEDNIRMDVREIVWEVVDWMHLAPDRDN